VNYLDRQNIVMVTQQAGNTESRILEAELHEIRKQADRLFSFLMVVQFFALLATAYWLSPLTWQGAESSLHIHLQLAFLFGGSATLIPALLGWKYQGSKFCGYMFGVSQMFVSALLIHLLGGRIEAHFHVFVSLAFLTAYRDMRPVFVAAGVIAVDHIIRSLFAPYSVFGTEIASLWRAFEHAGWVLFEVAILLCITYQNRVQLKKNANDRSQMIQFNEDLRRDVEEFSGLVKKAAMGDLRESQASKLNRKELEDLDENFAAMLKDLREVIVDICNEAIVVQKESEAASKESGAMNDKVETQSQAVRQIESSVDELFGKIGAIRENGVSLFKKAESAANLAAKGEAAVRKSNDSVKQMEEDSSRIRSGLTEIRNIAEKTNLLALNATIEAARAGHYGKGFSVVAEEVKQLAKNSREAVEQIEELLSASAESIEKSVSTSQETSDVFSEIIHSVQTIRKEIDSVVTNTEEQEKAALQVQSATDSVRKTSEDTNRKSVAISSRCEHLKEISSRLNTRTEKFKL